MNIPNKLKNKVINHEFLTEEETNLFIKFIIHKSKIITEHMYPKNNYLPIYLFHEICYSYNLESTPLINNNNNYAITKINNKKYLIDFSFNNDKIPFLKDNKYIEYNEKTYKEYLKILEE